MEKFIVAVVIILMVFLQGLPLVIGYLNTPSGNVFLGTIHWPGDYFYYLSQFVQGKTHWFWSYDLYTNDFSKQTLVGWVNVFFGKLFSLVGIHQFAAYQLLVPVLSVVFLWTGYLLIRHFYPSDAQKRIIAFTLFVFSNAVPFLESQHGAWSVSFYDFWTNNGLPFNRLVGVPHQLLERICMVLIILSVLRYWNNKGKVQWKNLLLWVMFGFVLASIEPVHFLLVILFLLVTVIIWLGKQIINRFAQSRKSSQSFDTKIFLPVLSMILPVAAFSIAGAPMVYYLRSLFLHPPFIQLRQWEDTQQIVVGFIPFLLASGPVAFLSFIGLPLRFTKPTQATLLAIVWVIGSMGIFFSPLPTLVGIVNARFMSTITIVFLAIFATDGLSALEKLTKRTISVHVFFAMTLLILLPTYWVQIGKRLTVQPDNAFYYIRRSAYDTLMKAKDMSNEKDTFFVIWPFNVSFPGITGRRVFEGHHLLTIDSGTKEQRVQSFFFSDMSVQNREGFLRENDIDYIVMYPWAKNIQELSNVQKVYDSGYLAIFKVLRSPQ